MNFVHPIFHINHIIHQPEILSSRKGPVWEPGLFAVPFIKVLNVPTLKSVRMYYITKSYPQVLL